MSSPDPESFSLLGKVIGAFAVVAAPVGWLWTKLDKKADKHSVNTQFQAVQNEIATQRTNIGKIFDQMRDDRNAADARHREVLMHLLENKK